MCNLRKIPDQNPFFAHFDCGASEATELLTGQTVRLDGGLELPGYSVMYLQIQIKE